MWVEARVEGDHVRIEVRDDGPGIADEAPRARVRAVLPRRSEPVARGRRHRPRPLDRQAPGREHGRRGRGRAQHPEWEYLLASPPQEHRDHERPHQQGLRAGAAHAPRAARHDGLARRGADHAGDEGARRPRRRARAPRDQGRCRRSTATRTTSTSSRCRSWRPASRSPRISGSSRCRSSSWSTSSGSATSRPASPSARSSSTGSRRSTPRSTCSGWRPWHRRTCTPRSTAFVKKDADAATAVITADVEIDRLNASLFAELIAHVATDPATVTRVLPLT